MVGTLGRLRAWKDMGMLNFHNVNTAVFEEADHLFEVRFVPVL